MLLLREFKNPKGYLHVKILGNILYSLPIHLNSSSSEEKVKKYSRRKNCDDQIDQFQARLLLMLHLV